MRTKRCFKCGHDLPLSDFYRHPEMADGRLGKCKPCTRADVRENRRRREDQYREYEKQRSSLPKRRALRASVSERYNKSHPARVKAKRKVQYELSRGRMERASRCEECGSDYHIHAHHDDYSRPTDVRWLCARCHRRHHATPLPSPSPKGER